MYQEDQRLEFKRPVQIETQNWTLNDLKFSLKWEDLEDEGKDDTERERKENILKKRKGLC
jgi:hypothetical protein